MPKLSKKPRRKNPSLDVLLALRTKLVRAVVLRSDDFFASASGFLVIHEERPRGRKPGLEIYTDGVPKLFVPTSAIKELDVISYEQYGGSNIPLIKITI